jgi:hypothetical protein
VPKADIDLTRDHAAYKKFWNFKNIARSRCILRGCGTWKSIPTSAEVNVNGRSDIPIDVDFTRDHAV